MTLSKQSNKKIGIMGLGITGTSAYKELIKLAREIICYDDSETSIKTFIKEFGSSSLTTLDSIKWTKLDKIIVSPGVPHLHPIFHIAAKNQIPVISDIELFLDENPNSEFIFVTGTNGKSTVVALTSHILTKAGLDYHAGGNIGTAVLSLPHQRKGYVLELSSFQIELLKKINPKISVITNISTDHLDRYKNKDIYSQIKQKIFTHNSVKIIGINNLTSYSIYKKIKRNAPLPELIPVSNSIQIQGGVSYQGNSLYDNTCENKIIMPVPFLSSLQGAHNRENIGISYAICRSLSLSYHVFLNYLKTFKGLEHRMQYIDTYKNINFFNDSKATNMSSAIACLSSFTNIVWFAGGRFKEDSFDNLKNVLKNIRKAYFFGESKNLFAEFFNSLKTFSPEYEICTNLEEAFNRAIKDCNSVEVLDRPVNFLLTPACASYDQFRNFRERGELFIKLIRRLTRKI